MDLVPPLASNRGRGHGNFSRGLFALLNSWPGLEERFLFLEHLVRLAT